jgi:hypothetical protein
MREREKQVLETYYYAMTGAKLTGKTAPVTGNPSEWFREEARYYRALGDEVTASKWDKILRVHTARGSGRISGQSDP